MHTLPSSYAFEIPKAVQLLRQTMATLFALQMPEVFLIYRTTMMGIVIRHSFVQFAVILDGITYVACCINKISARAHEYGFLVH